MNRQAMLGRAKQPASQLPQLAVLAPAAAYAGECRTLVPLGLAGDASPDAGQGGTAAPRDDVSAEIALLRARP